MFELRRLRLLHELAQRGTLAAVAEALSYSPSTISQQLAQLEKEAGVPLLAPDGRRVRLTEHGAALAAHAARALALDEEVRAELETLRPGVSTVRIAVLQTTAHAVLPTALTLLAEREPGLRVEVAEVPPEEGLFELSARRFDLVIAEQYPGHTRAHTEGLEREALGADGIRLALPLGADDVRPAGLLGADDTRPAGLLGADDTHPALAPGSTDAARTVAEIDLASLRDRPWVMEPAGTAARRWAEQQCRAAGFEPDVRFEVADLTAHVRLIAAGHAVGMLPDLVWAGEPPPVRLAELPGHPARELFTAARRSSSARPGIRAVRDALRDALGRRSEAGRAAGVARTIAAPTMNG